MLKLICGFPHIPSLFISSFNYGKTFCLIEIYGKIGAYFLVILNSVTAKLVTSIVRSIWLEKTWHTTWMSRNMQKSSSKLLAYRSHSARHQRFSQLLMQSICKAVCWGEDLWRPVYKKVYLLVWCLTYSCHLCKGGHLWGAKPHSAFGEATVSQSSMTVVPLSQVFVVSFFCNH